MPFGPIQLIVIGFDHPEPDGSILAELNAVRDQGLIRLVHALAVYKDEEGSVWSAEVSDLTEDEAVLTGAAIGGLIAAGVAGTRAALNADDEIDVDDATDVVAEGVAACCSLSAERYEYGLSAENLLAISDQIPVGGGALLMMIEHTWLTPLRSVIRRNQGGIGSAQEFLSPEALLAIGEDLAAVEELQAGATLRRETSFGGEPFSTAWRRPRPSPCRWKAKTFR